MFRRTSISYILKKVDIFGKRVYLTHDTKEMYKTHLGGIFSIAFIMGLFCYTMILCAEIWAHAILSITEEIIYIPPTDLS
jgi:hypothetical protein